MLDHHLAARGQAQEVLLDAQLRQSSAIALDQQESSQVAPVRFELNRLEALDLSRLLQAAEELQRLLEHLQRQLLAAADRAAPTNEKRTLCHTNPPRRADL